MTNQEAIDLLRFAFPKEITKPVTEEVISKAVKSLEKQIPKKWQYEMVNDYDTYVCPCCKEYWYMYYGTPATNEYNYCPNCGQRLDWSDIK